MQTDEGKVGTDSQELPDQRCEVHRARPDSAWRRRAGPEDVVRLLRSRDSGIGIAAEDLPRIFEDYGQIDSHLQKRVKGTGLGLPLTRKLARCWGEPSRSGAGPAPVRPSTRSFLEFIVRSSRTTLEQASLGR